ncbi:MAG: HAD family phosphatase [Egibacteraceae bacterium]
MPRALLFDLMGTVIHDPFREAVEAATGLDLETVIPLVHPSSWADFEIAAIDEATFTRAFYADPQCPHAFDREVFHRVRRDGYRWLPGMQELLAALGGVVETYTASNYPVWVEELAQRFAFADCFDGVYASHHLGVRKPAPEFFDRLLARIGHDPGDCLFVDDRAENCVAAQAAGIRAHRFDGVDGLRHRLCAEGVHLST